MDKLIEQAVKVLTDNIGFKEIELSDGVNKVRVVRNAPYITYGTNEPYTYKYSTYGTNEPYIYKYSTPYQY